MLSVHILIFRFLVYLFNFFPPERVSLNSSPYSDFLKLGKELHMFSILEIIYIH